MFNISCNRVSEVKQGTWTPKTNYIVTGQENGKMTDCVTHENVEGSNNEVGQAGNKVEQLCVA
jgi:hypothetical protein